MKLTDNVPNRAQCTAWVVRLSLFVACGVLSFVPGSYGQSYQLLVQRPPYYVGEPVVVQIKASDIEGQVNIHCRLAEKSPSRLQVQGPNERREMSSSVYFDGRRTVRKESSVYYFDFVVTANSPGEYQVGPFEIEVNGAKEIVDATRFQFEQVADDPDMKLTVTLPSDTFYVGQRVPVTIRWAFAGDRDTLQYAFQNLDIRSPLFDQFTFAEQPRQSQTGLSISTAKGTLQVDAEVSQEAQNGRTFIVVTGNVTMIADAVGDHADIPVTCRTIKATGFRRSLFGSTPSRTIPAIAAGAPLSFSVKALPTEGRPESFAGAVGTGFSIEVAANRIVVRVSDPISLNISVQGDGNLEKLSLPSLRADGGLSAAQFQWPDEPPAGNFDGRTKQFKVSVRVQDELVTQIPALAFSWFDPSKGEYQTTKSKPIALQVMPAQVVSAADVVSGAKSPEEESADRPNGEIASGSRPLVADLYSQGANLAIEQDPAKLLSPGRGSLGSPWMQYATYGAGVAAMLASLVVRKQASILPHVADQKKQAAIRRQALTAAASMSPKQGAEKVAAVLRSVASQLQGSQRARLDALVAECETVVYATSSKSDIDTRDLVTRAQSLLDELPRR